MNCAHAMKLDIVTQYLLNPRATWNDIDINERWSEMHTGNINTNGDDLCVL